MGLRPPGRRAQAQRQGRLVEGHGLGEGRRRRPRLRRHDAPRSLARQRTPGRLPRPPGRVPRVPPALEGGPAGRAPVPRMRRRPHRDPHVQHHVQDLHGPRRGERQRRLPPARNGPGHLRQLQQRPHRQPPQAALRHRPGRQGLPQRDHHRKLHLPNPRVRDDGDRVLRQARRGRGVAPPMDRPGPALVRGPGRPGGQAPGAAPRPRTSYPTTPRQPPTSSTASPGAGARSRASPTAPTTTSRPTARPADTPSATSTTPPGSASSPTSSSPPPASTAPP